MPRPIDDLLEDRLPWKEREQVRVALRNKARLRGLDAAGFTVSSPANEVLVKDEFQSRLEYAIRFVEAGGSLDWAHELGQAIIHDPDWALALAVALRLK